MVIKHLSDRCIVIYNSIVHIVSFPGCCRKTTMWFHVALSHKLLLRAGYGRAKKVRHGSSRSTSGEGRRGNPREEREEGAFVYRT
ncbi:hypothetical protein CAJAP_04874 [Camponotus japonicus]